MLWLAAQSGGQDLASGVVGTINRFTEFLLGYLAALAAVGALAMAVIEFAKKVFDFRTRFHARRVLGFAENTAAERAAKARTLGIGESSTPTDVLADLIQLGTGVTAETSVARAARLVETRGRLPWSQAGRRDPAYAVFALEIERMVGAMQEAGEIALSSPRRHPHLFLLMTSGASDDDVDGWYRNGERTMAAASDPDAPAGTRDAARKAGEQFTRLRQAMKRRLDAFQLYTSDSWTSWNQLWANLVGAATMFAVLMWMRSTDTTNTPGPVATLILSVLGGILSPVAKDLISLLKRVKDG